MFVLTAIHNGSGHGPISNTVLVTSDWQLALSSMKVEEVEKLGYKFAPDADQGILLVILETDAPYSKRDHETFGGQPGTSHHAHSWFQRRTANGWEAEQSHSGVVALLC